MLVLGPLFGTGSQVAGWLGLGSVFATAWEWLRPFVALVAIAWSAAVFHLGPGRAMPWRSSLPGGVLTGVWWLLASAGFRVYLGLSSGVNQVFGVLGGALILMTWMYLLSLGLVVGGELNAVWAHRHGVASAPRRHPRSDAAASAARRTFAWLRRSAAKIGRNGGTG